MYLVKIKNKLLALFVCSVLISAPLSANAQQITNLEKDDPAPYAGVLMDTNTAAEILANEEYKKVECDLKIKFQVEKLEARHVLEMGTLQSRFDSLKEQNLSILRIKDAEILRLQEMALNNPNDNAHWWMAGGVVAGIVTSIAIFYAAVEVKQ